MIFRIVVHVCCVFMLRDRRREAGNGGIRTGFGHFLTTNLRIWKVRTFSLPYRQSMQFKHARTVSNNLSSLSLHIDLNNRVVHDAVFCRFSWSVF